MTSSSVRIFGSICTMVFATLALSACGSTGSSISQMWYDQRWESSGKAD